MLQSDFDRIVRLQVKHAKMLDRIKMLNGQIQKMLEKYRGKS